MSNVQPKSEAKTLRVHNSIFQTGIVPPPHDTHTALFLNTVAVLKCRKRDALSQRALTVFSWVANVTVSSMIKLVSQAHLLGIRILNTFRCAVIYCLVVTYWNHYLHSV